MTQKEIIIEARLRTDQEFLEKCILLLYEKQTEDEQAVGGTIEENGVGFNRSDSLYFSSLAEHLLSGKHLHGTLVTTRYKLLKYVKQLSNYLTDDEIEG